VRAPVLLLVACLLPFTPVPGARADPTPGSDAAHAIVIGPGDTTGVLAADQPSIWYAVDTPAGEGAMGSVAATDGSSPCLQVLGAGANDFAQECGAPVGAGNGGRVYFVVFTWGGASSFTLTVRQGPLPLFQVTGFDVVPTATGPVPDAHREVRLTIENLGDADGVMAVEVRAWAHSLNFQTGTVVVDRVPVAVSAHSVVHARWTWDASPYVGRVDLSEAAHADVAQRDHVQEERAATSVLLPDEGLGVEQPLIVNPMGDASGGYVTVSGTGDARGDNYVVSGTGDATACPGGGSWGSCFAVGGHDASACEGGDHFESDCEAIALTGEARSCQDDFFAPCGSFSLADGGGCLERLCTPTLP